MTAPKTLLELAGAAAQPAALAEACIIVIDAQNEYVTGGLALPQVDPKIVQIGALLDRARAADRPVIHVKHQGRPGGLFDPSTLGGEIVQAVAPEAGEPVVEKRLPNAFAGTNLKDRLEALGRPKLIFAGFMTHMCVSSSVRAALDLGFTSTVVASASGTRALPGIDGENDLDAELLHHASLAALADRFATIVRDVDGLPE